MAIDQDTAIWAFGTQDEVTVASPSAIDGNNGISTTSDINEWTNDDDASLVIVVVNVTYAAVPDSGTLDLYYTINEVQSTNDEPTMDSAYTGHLFDSQTPDEVTSSQYLTFGPTQLKAVKTSQPYQFYLQNSQGDAAHDISSGWSMWVTPISYKPHPA